MRIREIGNKAENLVERGEEARRQQTHFQQAASNARSQMMAAYSMLDAARETDEDGNPRGDVQAAQSMLFQAQLELSSAEERLSEATAMIESVDREKRATIREVDRYTEGERKNLSRLQELQGKRFGGNVNAFIADLVARMNAGQDAKRLLQRSLGEDPTTTSFTATSVAGASFTAANTAAEVLGAEQAGTPQNVFQRLFSKRKITEPRQKRLGNFLVDEHGFVKGNNYTAFIQTWNGYDPALFSVTESAPDGLIFIDPNMIEGIHLNDTEVEDPQQFWSHHLTGGTEESFLDIARLIPEVRAALESGRTLEELLSDPRLGICASIYFDKSNAPRVYECDGYYEFIGNGRHRILAARSVGQDVPVQVIGRRERLSAERAQNESASAALKAAGEQRQSNQKGNQYIAAKMIEYGVSARVDFGDLDCRTSRDIFLAVSETKQQFPELDLQFVGSAQSRNKAIEEDLRKEYMAAYKQSYPAAAEDDLRPFVERHVSEAMSGLSISAGTIAQSLYVDSPSAPSDDLLSAYNGISINESFGSSYEHFVQVKQADVQSGWKPVGCNTPKATVDHELGHQIAKLVDADNDPEIKQLYQHFMQANEAERPQLLSGYAADSIHEFIAESWSEYRNNPSCRNCARLVASRIFELYNDMKLQRSMRR